LKKYSLTVSKGDWVSCGEKIGEVGSSGYSTGPHLHFEVRDGSESAFDPFAGDCSVDESAWFEQGSYGELPAPVCAGEAEACEPIELLTCGDVIESSNTAPGSTDTHWYYGCSEWVYSGPEVAYTFQTDRDEPVTVSITGLTGDLDLYALESDACDGTGCLASSSQSNDADESVSFDAAAGQEVVIVIDGWEAAESNFTLTIDCEGQLPEGLDTADGMDSADTGAFSTDSGQEGRSPLSDDEGEGAGCGCSAGPSGPSGAALMLAVVGLGVGRRRRAPR
jgi:MYXO-CTERM domain-containing protein